MADTSSFIRHEILFETDLEALLPTEYVSSVSERMRLYKEMDSLRTDDELETFKMKLIDMFGDLPEATQELLKTIALRREAAQLGFNKSVLKNNKLTAYFAAKTSSSYYQSDAFGHILSMMQKFHPQIQMKEVNQQLNLTIHKIPSIKSAMHWIRILRNGL
jgi:transcription-repair coupling factor (superfamily II helicase)